MAVRPLSRPVAVIGVGSTKFGSPFETPELDGLAFQEYAAWAVLDALRDAGVNPREVDHLCVGSISSPTHNAMNVSPQFGLLEWCGMKGKSATYMSAGCATGFNIFEQAVDMVAGGRCDIVVAVDVEISQSICHPQMPSHFRFPMSDYAKLYGIKPFLGVNGVDTSYQRWVGSTFSAMDSCGRHYLRDHGISQDDLEDACIGSVCTAREHGALGPDCYATQPYEEIAAEYGFDSVTDYMKSDMDPFFSDMDRVNYTGILCEGAAAVVVCAKDIAKRYQAKPIEVVNVAQCDYSVMTPNNEQRMTRGAGQAVYAATGYAPEQIDYLASTNMDQFELIDSAEALGYMPEGEAWRIFRDRGTRFDSAYPVNTDGCTQGTGHAFAATGIHNYKETVLQMRGEAQGRQIEPAPKVAMLRGHGATHSTTVAILRTEDAPAPANKKEA